MIGQPRGGQSNACLKRREERLEMGRMQVRQTNRIAGQHLGHPVGSVAQSLSLLDHPLPGLLA